MARFVGKFVGFVLGFAIAGLNGAWVGLILGHIHDLQSGPRPSHSSSFQDGDYFPDFSMDRHQRSVFAIGVIVLGAKLAKIDGPVSREEVMAFRQAFRPRDSQLAEIGQMFDRARLSPDGYEPYAARLAHAFGNEPEILEEILAGLFYIAIADSPRLMRSEMLMLRRLAVIFGFGETDFVRIAGRVGIYLTSVQPAPKKDTAYDILGLPSTATDDVIKRTYRALVRKHHPDKLVAAGLPASRIAEATEKIKMINAAYAEICKMRNIK